MRPISRHTLSRLTSQAQGLCTMEVPTNTAKTLLLWSRHRSIKPLQTPKLSYVERQGLRMSQIH